MPPLLALSSVGWFLQSVVTTASIGRPVVSVSILFDQRHKLGVVDFGVLNDLCLAGRPTVDTERGTRSGVVPRIPVPIGPRRLLITEHRG